MTSAVTQRHNKMGDQARCSKQQKLAGLLQQKQRMDTD